MEGFEQGDVVRVPFPYTDRDTRHHRPELVVSAGAAGEAGALLWVVMITSAENPSWRGDVPIPSHKNAGLPAASVVRPCKIATIEMRHAQRIGKLAKPTLKNVMRQIHTIISEAS